MAEKMHEVPIQDKTRGYQPLPVVVDMMAPPTFSGPPGMLLPFSTTTTQGGASYGIYGSDTQVLQYLLMPGEQLVSEPAAMVYRAPGIKMTTGIGGFKRMLGGESFFQNTYTNQESFPVCIAVTPDFPSKIIPVDLSRTGVINVTPGLYIAHVGEVQVTFKFISSIMAGCFGGNGFFQLEIKGTGTVFLTGGGSVMEKILADGEELVCDSDSLVAWAQTASYNVRSVGGCLTCLCGGEGLFNTVITGPGLVVVHTMAKRRLRKTLAVRARNPPA